MWAIRPLNNPMGKLAMLLEQAAIGWGFVLTLAYWIGFALLLPQSVRGVGSGAALTLPLGPPAVGLALGLLGLLAAKAVRQPIARPAVVALALNASAMALAAALRALLASGL